MHLDSAVTEEKTVGMKYFSKRDNFCSHRLYGVNKKHEVNLLFTQSYSYYLAIFYLFFVYRKITFFVIHHVSLATLIDQATVYNLLW